MLLLIVGILIILWLLGFFVLNLGALIHILLVIALIVLVIKVVKRI